MQTITVFPISPVRGPQWIMAPSVYWLRNEERTWAPRPYRLGEDQITWGPLWDFRPFLVADRLYLHELRRLDLKDRRQLVDFCNRFGVLGIGSDTETSLPLDEVRRSAALVRTLTSIYHLHQLGRLDRPGIEEWPWDPGWVTPPVDGLAARRFLITEMNQLLSPLTPTIGFGEDPQSRYTLLDVLVIQLFNDMAAGITFKTCANETCRGLFVHQIDREAEHHSRVKGTKYCTPHCARAQAQREYRRRRDEA